jgi:RNA polymerase sigma-70 factor (ECF subfamily)
VARRPFLPDGEGDGEAAILARAKAGDAEAWAALYQSLAPAVAGYLRLRGGRDVDDLTSETFLGVFRNIGAFSGSSDQFRSWVFVIAHRRLQDDRRHRARHPEEAVAPAVGDDSDPMVGGGPAGDVEHDAWRAMGTARVRALCDRLAPDQGDVLLLRILGDLTVDQVAEVVGKSPGAVKQLQRRGLDALRRMATIEGVPL